MDTFERTGLRFDVIDGGPSDGPVVVLLHGFPQTADSWAAVASLLHADGYRTVAPDQRGYSPGARPRGRGAYRVDELVADTVALIGAVSDEPVHVVGHDWGAVVAWALAGAHPELVATVTGVSVPHPGAFVRSMGRSRQALLSWYMLAFQAPGIERLLARPGAIAAVSRRAGQSPEAARRDEAALRSRGPLTEVLRGTLNWYRALPLSLTRSTLDPRNQPVVAPAMMIWSDGDIAISRAAAEADEAFMAGPYRFEVLRGVSHWIPDEAPDRLAALLLEHVGGGPRG